MSENSINRIRLEFKVPTLFENIPKIIGINRIRLEFKGICDYWKWNYIETGINRIRLEFKVYFFPRHAASFFPY